MILKDKYQNYVSALQQLNIESLFDRRESLCLKFARKGLKLDHFKKMFPVQKHFHHMEKRNVDKFLVNSARTERYFRSSIPSMQRLLNSYERKLKNINVSNELYSRDSPVVKI